jgi:HK97 family phage major capsid protein
LIEFGALRISHGFAPLQYEEMVDDDDKFVGWHIKEYEIMEVSLVSVPSNVDAVITAYGEEKLSHPVVKEWAKGFYDKRPKSVQGWVQIDMAAQMSERAIEPEMERPYPNEHACRLRSPSDFQADSFRRVSRSHDGKKYSVIIGRLRGQTTMTEQAYRYPKDSWTTAQARSHCKSHDGQTFEPASTSSTGEETKTQTAAKGAVTKGGRQKTAMGPAATRSIGESHMSDELRRWAIQHLGLAEDTSEEDVGKALAAGLIDGTITADQLAEASGKKQEPDTTKDDSALEQIAVSQQQLAESMAELAERLRSTGEEAAEEASAEEEEKEEEPAEPAAEPADTDEIEKRIQDAVRREVAKRTPKTAPTMTASEFIATSALRPRVKSAAESYSTTKSALVHPQRDNKGCINPRAGQPAEHMGRHLESPSDLDRAVIGSFVKWQLLAQGGRPNLLNEHERGLIEHALHKMTWTGMIGHPDHGTPVDSRMLSEWERKALLDDTTSGGQYVVPDVFDAAIVAAPILYGELYPLVEVVPLARGSSVDGATWTDPSWTWGSTEGSAFSVITTTGLIGNLDTTIFPTVAAIELGLDWESDTPINFGAYIVNRLGMKLMETLDEQVAIGDGTQEPTGIFTASGATSVSSASGTDGPMTVDDVEDLAWGLSKAMRSTNPARCVYVMTDQMYRTIRAIPIDSTNDARRIFGMDHSNYTLLDWPVRVQNSITRGSLAFVNMSFYRMYRRLGMQVRNVTEGQTLALKNTRLLVFRARFGGQPTLGAAISKMTDAQWYVNL